MTLLYTSELDNAVVRQRRRTVFAAVAAAMLIVALGTSCNVTPTYFTDAPTPAGDAPLRYRDAVFPTYDLTSDIAWSTSPALDGSPITNTLDMYQPRGDTATQRPALIVAHSGGFYTHTKTDRVSTDTAKHFVQRGYVVISINYRLLAKVDCGSLAGMITDISGCKVAAMAATSDGQAAVRWLKANATTYGIDPGRIAMTGDSAGAIMSILAGMLPAVADNPTDPASIEYMGGATPNISNLEQTSEIQAWTSISGGLPPTETPGLTQRLIDGGSHPAPGFFFAGTADNQVPYSWTEATRDELVNVPGGIVGFRGFQGAGHVPWSGFEGGVQYKTTILSQQTNFFYYLLNLGAAQQ